MVYFQLNELLVFLYLLSDYYLSNIPNTLCVWSYLSQYYEALFIFCRRNNWSKKKITKLTQEIKFLRKSLGFKPRNLTPESMYLITIQYFHPYKTNLNLFLKVLPPSENEIIKISSIYFNGKNYDIVHSTKDSWRIL